MDTTPSHSCAECGEANPDAFYRYKRGALYKRCKPCHYKLTQTWRAQNREKIRRLDRERYYPQRADKIRARKMLRKYGLTQEAYAELLERQGGVCPICLGPIVEPIGPTGGSGDWALPSVDHCHETGKVRGVLHRRCNLAIEFLLPDDAVARARTYIQNAGDVRDDDDR